jgi:multiple sugar transport system substrate-binding protein
MEPGSLQGTVDFQAVVAAFAPKHPEIKVHFEPSAQTGLQGSYDEQLVTLMAGGTGPDVFKTEYPGFASFATSGAYLDLDPYVARDATVDLNGFFSEHLAASKYQGKLYALPVDGAPIAMFYNVDAYKEAGLALPTWDTTWEQALSAAQQLTKRDQTGQALSLGLDRPPWLPWVWSNGGDLFDAAGKTCLLDRPEAIAALQWIQDATVKYKVAPTAADLAKAKNGSEDLFTQAHLNTFFVNRGVLGTLSTLKSFHFDAAPIPQGPKGRMSQLAVGWTSVWSGSKQPQGAYTLLAYVTSDEGETVRMTHVFAAFPSRKALTQQSWYKDYKAPMAASTGIDTVFADTLLRGEARGWPENPKMPQVTQAINKQFAALYDGSKAAAAAVNAVLSS